MIPGKTADAPLRRPRIEIRHVMVVVPLLITALIAVRDIRDNSFLWHVRAGTLQLDLGRVLTEDPFSFASPEGTWRTQSWLAELGYGFLERAFGSLGWVGVFVFSVAALTLALLGLAIYRLTRSVYVTAAWLMVMAWIGAFAFQPRPVILSHALLAAMVLTLLVGDRVRWVLIPLMWLWAAVHGSWVIGAVLVGLWALKDRNRRLVPVLLASLGSVLLTAHGIGAIQILVSFATNSGALDVIAEWQPPDLGDIVDAPYALVIAALLVAAAKGRVTARELVVVVPFVVFGLTSARAILPAAIVVVPFAARAWLPGLPTSRTVGFVPVATLAVVAVAVALPLIVRQPTLDGTAFPSPSVLEAAGSQPYFHSDVVGGFLIWSRGPDELMYIDDRAELYGVERFEEYLDVIAGDYSGLFSEFGMQAAVAKPDWPLVRVLRADGWSIVQEDEDFVVLRAQP